MARVVADKIRTQVAATAIHVDDEDIHMRISIGIVACAASGRYPVSGSRWRFPTFLNRRTQFAIRLCWTIT